MTVIATLDIADAGIVGSLRTRRPVGARHAEVGICGPLGPGLLPRPRPSRVAVLAFWDDEQVAASRETAALDGWHAVLEPVRLHGAWPGVPDDLPRARAAQHEGPAVVLTLGQVRGRRLLPFLRASAQAEAAAIAAPGLIWTTGFAEPPLVASCSLWESTEALASYAYGRVDPGHPGAIGQGRAEPFHHREAFVRFRPIRVDGSLAGKNPLPAGAIAV